MPLFSSPEEVCVVFRSILDDAQFSPERFSIHNLKQCSFSYGVLEGNVAKISGYLHASEKITEAAVRTWIFDNRIHGEIKWTPVMPGKCGDWKKHPHLADIFAACDGGNRRLEHWMTGSAATRGRPRLTPAPADGGAAVSVSRPRGRPHRPPPVATDSHEQAAVRARLHTMLADSVRDLCGVLLPQDRSWVGQPKLSQVDKLMETRYAELARVLDIAPAKTLAAAPPPVPAADSPDQAALREKLDALSRQKLASVCKSVFPPPDVSWFGLQREQKVIALMSKPDETARALETNDAGSVNATRRRAAAPTGAPPPPQPPPPPPPPSEARTTPTVVLPPPPLLTAPPTEAGADAGAAAAPAATPLPGGHLAPAPVAPAPVAGASSAADAAGAAAMLLPSAGADAAPDPFAHMLGGGPWTTKFPSVAAMIEADLASFLRSFGFAGIPNEGVLETLCTKVLESIPLDDHDLDYGRKNQQTLRPGHMISTTCAIWLLDRFADHSGIKKKVPGCAGPFTAVGRRCRVDFDRRKCNDEGRVFTDAETFNVFTKDLEAYENFERRAKQPRADRAGSSQEAQTSAPSRPDLERTLRNCWPALQGGCQFAYVQVSHKHASVGVIDTRRVCPGRAFCERFCSLQWKPKVEEKRFVEHLLGKLGMSVTWGNATTVVQIGPDCQFRSTFKLLEYMFGTLEGTSSPDADQWTVHIMMQIARTWTMCRMAEEAHSRWPQTRPSLRTIFSNAVIVGSAPQPPPPLQPPLLTASKLSAASVFGYTRVSFGLEAVSWWHRAIYCTVLSPPTPPVGHCSEP